MRRRSWFGSTSARNCGFLWARTAAAPVWCGAVCAAGGDIVRQVEQSGAAVGAVIFWQKPTIGIVENAFLRQSFNKMPVDDAWNARERGPFY